MSPHSTRHSSVTARADHGGSCEACGRAFETPIQLTNLSTSPIEVYNACPFCFSKQSELSEALLDLSDPTAKEPAEAEAPKPPKTPPKEKDVKPPEQGSCPHFIGYLKKRPKNSPIPECCLTCPRMIECLL